MRVNKSSGFTLIEILIVAPIVILIIGLFISMIITMTGDVLSTKGKSSMAYNIQDALNRIEQDVKLSGSYLAATNLIITSPQGYNNDTTAFHNATTDTTIGPMLILNSYTTTSNPTTSVRNLVYTNTPYACNSGSASLNFPLVMNVIYFVKGNTLWRRTIANSNYATIGCDIVAGASIVPWQQPSCAPGTTGTMCITQDIRLVDGVSSSGGFVINYYTSINPDVENTTASDGSQSDATRFANLQTTKISKITINATGVSAGRDIIQSGSVIVTSPNNNFYSS